MRIAITISFLLIVTLLSCNKAKHFNQVIYYSVAATPKTLEAWPLKNEDLLKGINETGKILNLIQVEDLNRLINTSSLHSNVDCGTIWKDGIFVFYDTKGKIEKYVAVSLDCYDIILNNVTKVNLNEEGKAILLRLIN